MSWEKLGRAKEQAGLGYRDLKCFNMALLAKQGWCLIQFPDSLVAKIFKEKYYPSDTFLETPLGNKPSYAWRSIWNAKPLLKEGLIWWVEDGESINIWKDKWIPSATTHAIQSPIQILDSEAKVCDLIDMDTNWWNTPLVEEVFNPEEAKLICGMVICPRTQIDYMVWGGTKAGVYMVRSAYHLAKDVWSRETGGGSSTSSSMTNMWKHIWKIRGPRTVKMFLWQACNDILPTKENLFKRKITEDPLCPICRLEVETVGHILWSFSSARDVWTECDKNLQKSTNNEEALLNIFDKLRG